MKVKAYLLLIFVFFIAQTLFSGEWDRMPNKSLPRLGKLVSSGKDNTIAITANGNSTMGWWSGYVYSVGKNTFNQLGRPTGQIPDKCNPNNTYSGSKTWFSVKKWGLESFVNNPLDPPNNGDPNPELETCSNLNNVFYVASGWYHNLAVRANGEVRAWGINSNQELGAELSDASRECAVIVQTRVQDVTNGAPIGPLNDIIAVDAGKHHSIALRADGTVWSWGTSTVGALGQENETTSSTAKRVKCFNPNNNTIEYLQYIIAISSGDNHCLALDAKGNVWAWGGNDKGQLGINSTENKNYAFLVSNINGTSGNLTNVISIDAAPEHSLAVLSNGEAVAWGNNIYGQLALYDYNNQINTSIYPRYMYYAPTNSGGNPIKIRDVTALSGCQYSTIALLASGEVRTAGRNVRGTLAIASQNENEERRYFASLSGNGNNQGEIWHIASGDQNHFMMSSEGTFVCGDNCYYQSSNAFGSIEDSFHTSFKRYQQITNPPDPVGIPPIPAALAGGAGNAWVLNERGDLNGWGWNYHWHSGTKAIYLSNGFWTDIQCNANVTTNEYDYSSLLPYWYWEGGTRDNWAYSRAIVGGLRHTATLTRSGQIFSWGSNIGAELCMGADVACSYNSPDDYIAYTRQSYLWHPSETVRNTETNSADGAGTVYAVAIGTNKGCSNNMHVPFAGYKYLKYPTYAVTSTGRVVGWGVNLNQVWQLTIKNDISSYDDPSKVAKYIYKSNNDILDNIVSVSAGQAYGIALDANGKIWMWGKFNPSSTSYLEYATQVGVEKLEGNTYVSLDIPFKSIVANGFANEGNFIMALAADGNIYTLGVNTNYQCGRSDANESGTKLRIIRDNEVTTTKLKGRAKSIDASYLTSVALRSDGTIWSWGNDYKGQFGYCNQVPPIPNYLPHQAMSTPCTYSLDNITVLANTCECTFGMDATGQIFSAGQNDPYHIRGLASKNDINYFEAAPDRLSIWNPPYPYGVKSKDDETPIAKPLNVDSLLGKPLDSKIVSTEEIKQLLKNTCQDGLTTIIFYDLLGKQLAMLNTFDEADKFIESIMQAQSNSLYNIKFIEKSGCLVSRVFIIYH